MKKNQSLIILLWVVLFLFLPFVGWAHHGEFHSPEELRAELEKSAKTGSVAEKDGHVCRPLDRTELPAAVSNVSVRS